jgi:hypothetical protein
MGSSKVGYEQQKGAFTEPNIKSWPFAFPLFFIARLVNNQENSQYDAEPV